MLGPMDPGGTVMNARHAGEPLRVGAASIDITPAAGIRMQGYKLRHAEGITDRLSVSALAVGRAAPEWLMLSVDCIGLDRRFTARVRERLSASLNVPQLALTITCSHTHSGPATLPLLGVVEADAKYLLHLEERLVIAAETAVAVHGRSALAIRHGRFEGKHQPASVGGRQRSNWAPIRRDRSTVVCVSFESIA